VDVKSTYLGTMIGLATVAFGLIAAGAWNKFIGDAIALFLKPGNGLLAQFIYAVIITIIAIVVVRALAKLAEKEAELSARLGLAKKPPES
jgi:type III secretory pathway component EscV